MSEPTGYDEENERRQIRERSEKEGVDRLLDDLLFGVMETAAFGLPALILLLTAGNSGGVKWAGLVSWLTLTVGVGLARGDWVDVGWPSLSARQAVLRTVAYSLLIAVASLLGAVVRSALGSGAAGSVGTAFAAAVVTVAGLWTIARATGEK